MLPSSMIRLLPPYETNGSGTPVMGIMPNVEETLSSACAAIRVAMPTASRPTRREMRVP